MKAKEKCTDLKCEVPGFEYGEIGGWWAREREREKAKQSTV